MHFNAEDLNFSRVSAAKNCTPEKIVFLKTGIFLRDTKNFNAAEKIMPKFFMASKSLGQVFRIFGGKKHLEGSGARIWRARPAECVATEGETKIAHATGCRRVVVKVSVVGVNGQNL